MNGTVTELKAIAKDMGLRGYSKLTKSGLIALIAGEVSQLHTEALEMNAEFDRRKATVKRIVNGYREQAEVKREAKSYNERMLTRCLTYAQQNGYTIDNDHDVYPNRHFTPKQLRRYRHKYNAQYGKLSAKLAK